MASKEKSLGLNPPNLPLLRVKQEPIDDYEEGTDVDSRILDLNKRLIECEQSAKQAEEELENARESEMEWLVKSAEEERMRVSAEQELEKEMKEKKERARTANAEKIETERIHREFMEKYECALASSLEGAKLVEAAKIEKRRLEEELEKSKADIDNARKEWYGRLEESEKRRAKLEELLKKEKREREREKEKERGSENRETKKRQSDLARENEDLQDRLRKIADRVDRYKKDLERSERQNKEYKKGAEMKMERLENIRTELSKSVEETLDMHGRVVKERDGLREKLKEALDYQLDISKEVHSLRTRCCQLEKENEELQQKLIGDEEKEKRAGERWREIETDRKEIVAEAEKERVRFAEMNAEMEQLRAVNTFLVTNRNGELFEEVLEARERIRQLEETLRGMTLAGRMKEEDEEMKRKRPRKEPKEEEKEGDIKDTLLMSSPTVSESDGSTISSSSRSSTLPEKITVARAIDDTIAQDNLSPI